MQEGVVQGGVIDGAYCPKFQKAVELIGRRWSGAIVRALLTGSVRFGDILALVPHLSDRLLSERLREFEAEGIVTRTVFPEVPVRIEYRLTEKGLELQDIVNAIDGWAGRWVTATAEECAAADEAERAS